MPIIYKFRSTSANNELLVITDALNRNINNFTVTEVRGLDPEETQSGFRLREGQEEVYQADILQIATDNNWNLEIWDNGTFLETLNEVAMNFGIFNGTSAFVQYSLPTFPTGAFQLDISFQARGRFTVNTENSGPIISIGSGASSADSIRTSFTTLPAFPPDGGTTQGLSTTFVDFNGSRQLTASATTAFAVDGEFHTFNVSIMVSDTDNAVVTNERDGTQIATDTAPGFTELDNFRGGAQILRLGRSIPNGVTTYFEGDVRNLIVTEVTTANEIINSPDPSSGTNTGTGADGTVTDVTQGSL